MPSGDGVLFESRMFRFDPSHSGVVHTEGLDHFGGVARRFETGGPVRSTPALAGGILYFGSADGALYAVRSTDGGRSGGSRPMRLCSPHRSHGDYDAVLVDGTEIRVSRTYRAALTRFVEGRWV